MPVIEKKSIIESEVTIKKQRASKKKVVEEVLVDAVDETVVLKKSKAVNKEVLVETAPGEVDVVEKVVKVAAVVNKESVMNEFDAMIAGIDAEIENIRGDGKTKGVQFLRSVSSSLKKLQKHVSKISKGKTKRTSLSTSSGFLKPVDVSAEMRKFAGWGKDDLHSRVDVTKFICNYVKEQNLQFPADRRQIVPDMKLKKLFGIKSDCQQSIPYYQIQTNIKHHFVKNPVGESK